METALSLAAAFHPCIILFEPSPIPHLRQIAHRDLRTKGFCDNIAIASPNIYSIKASQIATNPRQRENFENSLYFLLKPPPTALTTVYLWK